jgi:hypothetical protein
VVRRPYRRVVGCGRESGSRFCRCSRERFEVGGVMKAGHDAVVVLEGGEACRSEIVSALHERIAHLLLGEAQIDTLCLCARSVALKHLAHDLRGQKGIRSAARLIGARARFHAVGQVRMSQRRAGDYGCLADKVTEPGMLSVGPQERPPNAPSDSESIDRTSAVL